MNRLSKMALLALSALALAVALAGCGGDETNDRPDGSADTDTDTGFDFDTDYPYDLDAGLRCDGGTDIMQPSPDGVGQIPTGVEECPDGSRHRYAAVPCTTDALDGTLCEDDDFDCSTCAGGQLCVGSPSGADQYCSCIDSCKSDADCADGEVCLCAQVNTWVSRCAPANCRTDAECGGYECGVSLDCCDIGPLMCRTAGDTCHGDGQCEDGEVCLWDSVIDVWDCDIDCDCE